MDEKTKTRPTDHWWQPSKSKESGKKEACSVPLKPGCTCPVCNEGRLAYDGLFILTCPACGHVAEHGVFT